VPEVIPNFSFQGEVLKESAALSGISEGAWLTYRSGDQPNNAFALLATEPG
jgi:xylulokinase